MLKTFDSGYFRGKNHFEEGGTQNYIIFQPMYRYFKRLSEVGTGNYIYFWKSKGFSDENITAHTASDYRLNLQVSYLGTKTRLEFKASCLKQDKITYSHGKIINIYIVYELDKIYFNTSPMLLNCLLEKLVGLKMLILISPNILDTEMDLIEEEFIQLVMTLVEM